jgi:muramidase (phage lysozyme)
MNSTEVVKRRAPPVTSLADLQIVARQVEEILGPLVVVENDGRDTILSFNEGRPTPATPLVFEPDDGQASPRAGVDELVTRGVCIIAGDRISVAAYRASFRGVQTVNDEIPLEGRALLDTIAGTESPGYDVLYGGGRFTDFSHHPNIPVRITSGPHKGDVSTAAGRYQFNFPTWTQMQREILLPDFSPKSQDEAAWHLAQTEYRKREGRGLLSDLQKGELDQVGPTLHARWTSLPGGIEQGVNANRFVVNYTRNLARYKTPPTGLG